METIIIDGKPYDLPAIERNCWHRLLNGAIQNRNVLQTPVVANLSASGINMRTVVLRKVWPLEKQLAFYTDTRSGKWEELQQQNNISWLFYDAASRIQIKATGMAGLHHKDKLADTAWSETNLSNRKNYLSELSPSTETPDPIIGLPSGFEQADPTPGQSEAGRKNFGVVITHIKRMEWLWLSSNGHRRAYFVYSEDGSFTAGWLVP